MSNGYFSLNVAETLKETDDTVSIVFKLSDSIKEDFKYKPGQHVNFKTVIDSSVYIRTYSMSSSPHTDEDLVITVKEIENGAVSPYILKEIKPGDNILVSKPRGKYVLNPDSDRKGYYVMFAAGSGIAPLYSMLKSVLHIEKESKVTLFYANRSEKSIIFKDSLAMLSEQYKGRFKTIHLLSQPSHNWTGLKGRLNSEIAKMLLTSYINGELNSAEVYMCGPDGFMSSAEEALKHLNVSEERIHSEEFNPVAKKGKQFKMVLPLLKKTCKSNE